MNRHLAQVREFHSVCKIAQADNGKAHKLADMDIITYQALLMGSGKTVFAAFKTGDMAHILAGITELAYYALSAIAKQGEAAVQSQISWQHDGFVISVMRLLSEKINACATGQVKDYSEIYNLCQLLTNSFINADFDGAFGKIHENNLALRDANGILPPSVFKNPDKIQLPLTPDLSDFLYE